MDNLDRENTILLVDARPWTREALARGIEAACRDFKVSTFADSSALAQAQPPEGAAIIMINATGLAFSDRQLSDALATARSNLPGLPIVLLSDSDDADGVLDAIGSGLRGYIPDSLELSRALDALRFVAAGGTFVPIEFAALGPAEPADQDRPPEIPGELANDDTLADASKPATLLSDLLTPREQSVLKWLSQGKSNKQIARELGIREATVKVHVRHLIAKFGAANRTQVALLAADLANQTTSTDEG